MSMNYSLIKKINVIGTSGSGKSTLAHKISDILSIPYIEMDRIFWKPNWTESKKEEFLSNLENSLSSNSWVLDGNYTSSIPVKWKDVQLIVWIDLPFSVTIFQAVKRAVKRSICKTEIWPNTGNTESFKRSFLSKNSILLWTIQTYPKVKKRFESYMRDDTFSHIKFIRLKSKKEVADFLDHLREVGK